MTVDFMGTRPDLVFVRRRNPPLVNTDIPQDPPQTIQAMANIPPLNVWDSIRVTNLYDYGVTDSAVTGRTVVANTTDSAINFVEGNTTRFNTNNRLSFGNGKVKFILDDASVKLEIDPSIEVDATAQLVFEDLRSALQVDRIGKIAELTEKLERVRRERDEYIQIAKRLNTEVAELGGIPKILPRLTTVP